jgi:choline-glycine betaine transporter
MTAFFAVIGMLVGLVGLVGSLIGMHVFFQFGPLHITGLLAGLIGLPLMPCLFALVGVVVGAITYLPVRWLARLSF